MKKFIRIISPITLTVILALDIAVLVYGAYAIKKIMNSVDIWTILFAIIEVFAIIIAVLVSKEVVSNGVVLYENKIEFTALDDNNCFEFSQIEKIETSRDTRASFKKNFVDRYSRLIIHLHDGSVVTIDLGLTSAKKLALIEKEIKERLH